MKQAKKAQIKNFIETNDDMPDGAFFAMAEEQGIDIDDWVEYSEDEEDEEA